MRTFVSRYITMNISTIFNLNNESEFDSLALDVFRFQNKNSFVYREFCLHLGKNSENVKKVIDIPFLPIEFFKKKIIVSNTDKAQTVFTSSGTTGSTTSSHYVTKLSIYEQSYLAGFKKFYGAITDYCVLALLPSYLEREGSSLIYMANDLIIKSKHKDSGFYLDDFTALKNKLEHLNNIGTKVLLIGVSYALLNFVEQFKLQLKNTIVMETGGMKGKRRELIREELHTILQNGFGVSKIHSEYGMTELLSQAYSLGEGIFESPPWMKILIRDTEDPLSYIAKGKTGGINVIDLANINSCSFIATQDLGRQYKSNSFEILGRFDHSDIRGCNLMVF